MYSKHAYTSAHKRELGKALFFNRNEDREKREEGLKLILEAYSEKDPEAAYIIARLTLDNVISSPIEDKIEYALSLMCISANRGCIQARAFLNAYCESRYKKYESEISKQSVKGPLIGFDGKIIKIDRHGVFTPVDAVLEFQNEQNILTLSVNVVFVNTDVIKNFKKFKQAVFDGILEWQGDYKVFGGQELTVKVNVTNDDRIIDNIFVVALTNEISENMLTAVNAIHTEVKKKQIADMLNSKRSFATQGMFKWSVNSRKNIFIQSADDMFNNYDDIKHIVKHEFGHALGLGDLYVSSSDALTGVEKGTYTDLDSYAIQDKYYNLVMCDYNGPICNNDIEMVVLAYKENRAQLFQPGMVKGEVSSALGIGN